MSYDFLGQFLGKARRRKIEAAAQTILMGGQKTVAVDFGVLGTRLVVGATVAVLSATLNHSLPTTAGGILTVAGIGLTGALPDALKSSGLRTALSPNTLSAVQGLGRVVSGVLCAPANAKKAAFQAAVAGEVQNVLNKTSMTGYTPAEMGQKAPDGLSAGSQAASAAAADADAQDGTVSQASISMNISTDAITLTGGNQ